MNIIAATECCGEVVNVLMTVENSELKVKDVLSLMKHKFSELYQLKEEGSSAWEDSKAFIYDPERNVWKILESVAQLESNCQLYFGKDANTIPHDLPKPMDVTEYVNNIKQTHISTTNNDEALIRRSNSPEITESNKCQSTSLTELHKSVKSPDVNSAAANTTTNNTKETKRVSQEREISILREERDKFERQLQMSVDELRQNLKREMQELERSLSRSTSLSRDVVC